MTTMKAPVSRPIRLAAALVLSAGCTVAQAVDLWTIYELARKSDPVFRAEQFQSEANQLKVQEARSALLPSITASAGRDRITDDLETDQDFFSQGRVTYNSDSVEFSLTQSVFDRQRLIGYSQSKDEARLAGLELESARQELLLRVARDYFSVLAARDNVDLTRSNRTTIAEQLELAEERLEVGLGTTTDLYDARARFKLAEAEEIRAQALLEVARQALAQLIGESPGTLDALRAGTPLQSPEGDIEAWVVRARGANVGVLIQEQAAEVSRKEVDRQRSGNYPVVDFAVDQTYSQSDGSLSGPGSDRERTDVLLQLTVPFYRGGRVSAQAKQAALRYSAVLEDLENSRRSAERATRVAYNDVVTDVPRVLALEQAVAASESALEAKREGFAAGLETNIDVLDAQRDLLEAQRNYLVARYEYILNTLRLERAVGILDEDDLKRVNSWLQ